jgi:hypothetical protein
MGLQKKKKNHVSVSLLRIVASRSRSYFTTDGQSVSQYVLVSGTPSGPKTRFYFLLSFAGKLLCSSTWGALSDDRTGL